MCGIVGMVGRNAVNQDLYDALTLLQHRGQDAAGIMTCDDTVLHLRKGQGLVRDVIQAKHMLRLQGNMGLGHVRYPTAGALSEAQAQPFYVNSPYGIALAHNGNLTNAQHLKKALWADDLRHLNTTSDSEVLLNVFAHELQKCRALPLQPFHIFEAVKSLQKRCEGAYSALAMIVGYGMVAFRDPYGIRPLCYGVRQTPEGKEYLFASESVALNALGFEFVDDVAPGEAVYVTGQGELYRENCATQSSHCPCLFEYVYLSRPDSILDKILVYQVRLRLGEFLADKILQDWPQQDIDVVIPIPETSRTAAYALSLRLGLPYREGFVKNHYIGRTFIMPGQKLRKKSVRQKLNAISMEFKDKNVLLVDDSIVRGTTAREIIQMAREAGAKKVYLASAAPLIAHPNVYGIDMPAASELIGHNRSLSQIEESLGADKLIYQELEALILAAREMNPSIKRFEDSVFTGNYVTNTVSKEYLACLSQLRQEANLKKESQTLRIDMPYEE